MNLISASAVVMLMIVMQMVRKMGKAFECDNFLDGTKYN